jgi:LAS superfamily LD-carboxypeptidase LdcB
VVASAYHQRVFTEVCALDEPNAYEWFIQSFPEAEPVIQAKQERYRWAYAEACLSNKLSAYQDFVRQYPDAPQVAEAMERIALKQKYNKAFLLGKTYPAAHPLFVRVRAEHTPKAEMYMHHEAYEAFSRMYEAALRDGVKLSIISGMRTFEQQAMIWNYKWSKLKGDGISRAQNIMVYSSMPGISRHHWGTDVDLNHLTNSYFDKGEGKKVYDWLLRHAREFGFYQVFDGHERAYAEERWHWSYMPVADVCLQEYLSEISYDDLRGFVGEELAPQLRVIERYVKGEGLRTE